MDSIIKFYDGYCTTRFPTGLEMFDESPLDECKSVAFMEYNTEGEEDDDDD